MSWTCPEHYKVHVHGRDSPERPVHGHCPVPLPALMWTAPLCISMAKLLTKLNRIVPILPYWSMPKPHITSLDVFGSCHDHFVITKSRTITHVMELFGNR